MHPASSVSHYTKLWNLTFTVSVETANSGSNPVLEISPLVDWPYNVATEFVGGVSDQGTGCWKTRHAFNLAYNPQLFAATEAMRLRKSSTPRSIVTLEKR